MTDRCELRSVEVPEVAIATPEELPRQVAVVISKLLRHARRDFLLAQVFRAVFPEQVEAEGECRVVAPGMRAQRAFFDANDRQDLMHESEVTLLQHLETGLRIGVELILVVERRTASHQIRTEEQHRGSTERRGTLAEQVQTAE